MGNRAGDCGAYRGSVEDAQPQGSASGRNAEDRRSANSEDPRRDDVVLTGPCVPLLASVEDALPDGPSEHVLRLGLGYALDARDAGWRCVDWLRRCGLFDCPQGTLYILYSDAV